MSFDPSDTPLIPGGEIKFPIVAGAPPEGIVCSLPDGWTGRQRTLVFLQEAVPPKRLYGARISKAW